MSELEHMIRDLNLPEKDSEEAEALVAEYSEFEDHFSHLFELLEETKSDNITGVVDELYESSRKKHKDGHKLFTAVTDFFACIGGAEATFRAYKEIMAKLDFEEPEGDEEYEEDEEEYDTDEEDDDKEEEEGDDEESSGSEDESEYEEDDGSEDDESGDEDEDEEEYYSEEDDEAEEALEEAMRVVNRLRRYWVEATDSSLEFAKRLASAGLISFLKQDLKSQTGQQMQSLILLHNCARNPSLRPLFRANAVPKLLFPLLQNDDTKTRLTVLLTLSYILEEKEADLISAEEDDFDFLLGKIKDSLGSTAAKRRELTGWKLQELLDGLYNLARNDQHKKLLMQKDVLGCLKPIMKSGSDEEKEAACKVVWQLALVKSFQEKMRKDKVLRGLLFRMTKSKNPEIKKCADGVSFVLGKKSAAASAPDSASASASGGHIMISYSWSQQKLILKIREELVNRNFRVWLDVDEMSGNTLDAMSNAVDGSTVLLLCASESYRSSVNCKTEAEYAHEQKKPIIPLVVEPGFKRTGWLGMIMGKKLYFDFSGQCPFEEMVDKLVLELNRSGLSS